MNPSSRLSALSGTALLLVSALLLVRSQISTGAGQARREDGNGSPERVRTLHFPGAETEKDPEFRSSRTAVPAPVSAAAAGVSHQRESHAAAAHAGGSALSLRQPSTSRAEEPFIFQEARTTSRRRNVHDPLAAGNWLEAGEGTALAVEAAVPVPGGNPQPELELAFIPLNTAIPALAEEPSSDAAREAVPASALLSKPGLTYEQELFRTRWGWAAFAEAQKKITSSQ